PALPPRRLGAMVTCAAPAAEAGAEQASAWLRRAAALCADAEPDEGAAGPAELLQEELSLLRQLHSEAVDSAFLRELWSASGGWASLRRREAQLRALALEHLGACHWSGQSSKLNGDWELLCVPYVQELPREVAEAVARAPRAGAAGGGEEPSAALAAATEEAERYVLEAPQEEAGASLWLDAGGNLETVLPASQGSAVVAPARGPEAAADAARACALCRVQCDPGLCAHPRELCWHCWHRTCALGKMRYALLLIMTVKQEWCALATGTGLNWRTTFFVRKIGLGKLPPRVALTEHADMCTTCTRALSPCDGNAVGSKAGVAIFSGMSI
ncbi:unnamed protein product, partial [Prorocentrum cordatum]